ncbi:MAG: thioredoxin family protein [Oligoflexia bacterium]|nr:thioredoxin family protein [Oligoflexia bacterium]
MKLLAITLLFISNSYASLHAPDYSLTGRTNDAGLEITAVAPDGHHFNLKAPSHAFAPDSASAIKPAQASEKKIVFRFSGSAPGIYATSLYLCDDARTFCEKKKEQLAWHTTQNQSAAKSDEPTGQTPAGTLSHGFLINQAKAAFAKARKENKPLIVDFFGIWCPPCNQLDERVFSSDEFTQESARFIKLKIDVDTEAAWAYTSRYKVNGYPTVVFLTTDGKEISRITGYRPLPQFLKTLRDAYAYRDDSQLSALQAQAKKGDRAAADRLGLIALGGARYAEAIHYLEGTRDQREKLWDAKIEAARLEKSPENLIKILKGAIEEFPPTPDSIQRRTDLAELLQKAGDPAGAKKLYQEAIVSAEQILSKNPQITAEYDSSPGDLWMQIAEAHEALDEADATKASYKNAAQEFRKDLVGEKDRGGNLDLAYSLWKSGDEKSAEEIYVRLEKTYSKDFTFYRGHARMKLELKKLDEAHALAERALDLSYGSNHLDVVLLMAKILKAQDKPDEARKLIDQTLAGKAKLPSTLQDDLNVRYLRALKRLEDYRHQQLAAA